MTYIYIIITLAALSVALLITNLVFMKRKRDLEYVVHNLEFGIDDLQGRLSEAKKYKPLYEEVIRQRKRLMNELESKLEIGEDIVMSGDYPDKFYLEFGDFRVIVEDMVITGYEKNCGVDVKEIDKELEDSYAEFVIKVENAYQALIEVDTPKKRPLKAELEMAIDKAVGYLGEALR